MADSLWQKILQDSTQKVRYREGNLILLGGKGAGKKSLVSALQKGPSSLSKSTAHSVLQDQASSATAPLFYHYLNVKNIEDPQSDRLTSLHVWICEEPKLKDLLNFALKPELLSNTVMAIVLDWEQPWRFLQDLREWLDIWHEKLSQVISIQSLSEQDAMVDKVQKYLQSYKEPGDSGSELLSELPLAEGVLSVNMGVPIIIVCNKVDRIWNVDKNRENCEKTLDYVLRSLRQFALTYGAALIYTSTTENVNINTFYEYALHRIYGFRSNHRAQVVDRNDIFVPAGWDSPNLVSEMNYLGMNDVFYEDILPKPKNRQAKKDLIVVPDEQEFLASIKEKLDLTASKMKRERDTRAIVNPNPGGEVSVTDSGATADRGQSSLHQFYMRLMEKSTKDAAGTTPGARP